MDRRLQIRRAAVRVLRSFCLLSCSSALWSTIGAAQSQIDVNRASSHSSAPTGSGAQPAPQAGALPLGAGSAAPKPRIQLIRLNEAGTAAAPVAPLAIPGAHVDYFGGPVISNVHIVQVLYGTGSFLPNIAGTATPTLGQFFTDVTQSSLMDMLNEYSNVGITAADGTAGTNQTIGHGFYDGLFTITPAAANNGLTITDNQIQSELLSQVTAGNLPAPLIDAQGNNNTLYMVYFPPGKTITAGGTSSCVMGGFCAYHNSTDGTFSSHRLFYGVMPDVQPPSLCSLGCGSGLLFDIVTNVTSHEFSEAVTDADVGPANALARPLAWVDPVNSEIGDICVGRQRTISANGHGYSVQTEFSNLQEDCVVDVPKLAFSNVQNQVPGRQFSTDIAIQSSGDGHNLANYTGTLHATSTDPNAVLPSDYTFSAADAGSHPFLITFNTAGVQAITFIDTVNPLITQRMTYSLSSPALTNFTVSAPQNAVQGSPVSFVVKAMSAEGPFPSYSGTIHFSSNDPLAILPPDSTLVQGLSTFSATFKTAGSHFLFVQDLGSLANGNTTLNIFVPGANATTTSLTTSLSPSVFGQPPTFTAAVTGANGPVSSGSIIFTLDGSFFADIPLDPTGHAQVTGSPIFSIFAGRNTIFAEYSGDPSHDPSSSPMVTQVVNPAPTQVSLTSPASSTPFGGVLSLTAVVTSVTNFSQGFVTFSDGGNPLSIQPVFGGRALFNVSSLPVGSHSLTAAYSGTANLLSSTSAPLIQVVSPAAPDYSLTPDKTSIAVLPGQSAVFTITAKSLNEFAGNLRFSCGNLPSLSTCTVSPAILFVDTLNNIRPIKLTVKTTGPNASLFSHPKRSPSYAGLSALGSLIFGFVLVGGIRRRGGSAKWLLAAAAIMFSLVLVSCGGGGGNSVTPGPPVATTPTGTTTMTLTASGVATSGSGPANPSQQLNLIINVQ
jgi:Bacterial Ig-like domain (group 3)